MDDIAALGDFFPQFSAITTEAVARPVSDRSAISSGEWQVGGQCQRDRILGAATQVVAETGHQATSVANVSRTGRCVATNRL